MNIENKSTSPSPIIDATENAESRILAINYRITKMLERLIGPAPEKDCSDPLSTEALLGTLERTHRTLTSIERRLDVMECAIGASSGNNSVGQAAQVGPCGPPRR